MKKLISFVVLTVALSFAHALLTPLIETTASVTNSTLSTSAPLQTQTPRPIRTLPGIGGITVVVGPSIVAPASYTFGPSIAILTTRLDVLDNLHRDMAPSSVAPGPVEAYDIFYSNEDGTLNPDGAYLTIEAVSSSQAVGGGGLNLAEINLVSSSSIERGNAVASFIALGNNADPQSVNNAIDGNNQTYTRLGNTVGQSQRLRITIGFLSSSGPAPCTSSNQSVFPGSLVVSDVGGHFTETVSATASCGWTAESPDTWVRITSGRSGTGSGTVSLEIDPNTNVVPRLGFIRIANRSFNVRQFGRSQCSYRLSLNATGATFTPSGGAYLLGVSGAADFLGESCRWGAASDVPWIDVGPMQIGEYISYLPLSVFPNLGSARTGRVLIGRETFIVRQGAYGRSICSQDAPKTIDHGGSVTSTLAFGDHLFFDHISLRLNIERDATSDLTATLTAPGNQTIEIFSEVGGNGESLGSKCTPAPDCVFTDYSALSIRDARPPFTGFFYTNLSQVLERRDLHGNWTLTITDRSPTQTGTGGRLNCWCLEVEPFEDGCKLTPQTSQVPIFTPHSVTARVSSNLSPAQRVPVNFSVHGQRGELRLNAQIPTNDRGEATLTYIDSEVGNHTVEAVASVGEVTFTDFATVSWVPNQSCPMETVQALAAAPDSEATLTTLRRFRDKELTQTPRGRRYTGLYYKFSSEAVRLMMFNPMLLLRSREIIERYKPVIESMVNSEQVTLTRGDVDEMEGLLNSFAGKASVEFQQAIKQVCEDLRDPQVQTEFGITVIDGPKRELPAHHLRQTINRAGGVALFMGFLTAFACCFAVAKRQVLSHGAFHAKREPSIHPISPKAIAEK